MMRLFDLQDLRLSTRITIAALFILVAGGVALMLVENVRLRDVYTGEHRADLEQRLRAETLRLNQATDSLRQDVLFLSNIPPVPGMMRAALNRGYDPRYGNTSKVWEERLQQIFSAFSSAHPDYYQIRYIGVADGGRELVRIDNRYGRIDVVQTDRLLARGDQDYFKAALALKKGEVWLSEFKLCQEWGEPLVRTLRAVTPVFTASGKVFGMVVINMDVGHLLESATSGLPKDVQAYISNMNGQYLLHPDARRAFKFEPGSKDSIMSDFPSLETMFSPQAPDYLPLQAVAMRTGSQLMAAEQIHFDPSHPARFLLLAYGMPDTAASQKIVTIPAGTIVSGLMAMLLLGGIALLVLRRTFTPLEQITAAADKIAAGDYDVLLPKNGSGEIGSLANAFGVMLSKLSLREQDITQVNDRLNALIEAIPDAIYFKDDAGRWLIANEPAKQFFQLHDISWQGKTDLELADLHPAFRAMHEACLVDDEQTWDAGRLTLFERNITAGDGVVRSYDLRKIPLFGEDGQRRGLVSIGRDITEQKSAEELLRKSAEEIEDLYNHAPCGYHSLDRDGIICRINDTELAWLGYTRDEVVGKMKWPDLLAPASVNTFWEIFPQLMKQGLVRDVEAGIIRKDGTLVVGLVNAVAVYDAGGNYVMSRSTVIDITGRKLAEEKLREGEARLRDLVGNLPGTVFEMVGGDGKGVSFSYVSESVAMLFGVAADDLMNKPELLYDCLYAEDAPGFEASRLRSARTLEVWDWEGRISTASQHRKWINLRATPRRRGDGLIVWGGVILNITNCKRTEIELVKSQQLLRDLAAQGEALREEERKRIAREIHDELGQILTALRMDVSLLRLQFGVRDAELLGKVQGMTVLLDRAIQGVRNVASNLRPTALDMGIVSAVEWLCDEFAEHTGVPCVVHFAEEGIDLDETHAVVIFRIVQESLTNVARHAKASSVEISLVQGADVLHVAVHDNGKGFNPADITNRKSFGLLGMSERAIALGGTVEITSAPQQGTVVSVHMPIKPNGGVL